MKLRIGIDLTESSFVRSCVVSGVVTVAFDDDAFSHGTYYRLVR